MNIDFDKIVSREGTGAEKYEARASLFGKPDVEPFWVADMDLPTPDFLTKALTTRMEHSMFGYTTTSSRLFDAIGWWMQHEHELIVETDWIRLSPSVVTSIAMGIQSLTKAGDGVLIPSPVYGPFFFASELNDRRVVDFPMEITNGQYVLDFAALERCIAKENPTLFMLCNPHNPGGRVWRRDELEKLVTLCNRYGVKIFSDEIHSDIVYAPNRHVPLLSIAGAQEISVVAHSIGKTFNTSGLCASFVLIPNKSLRKDFVAAQEKSHCGSVNLLGKVAMETAFSEQGVQYKRELVKYLFANTRAVVDALTEIPNASIMEPQATFLVWCDFRAIGRWPTVMRKLIQDANVALSGGTFFGKAGEGFFRINCAHPAALLLPAVQRIVKSLGAK